MRISSYDVIYLITNAFGMYIIYKFMNIFFQNRKVSKSVEALAYIAYFVVISSVYLFINIPMLTMVFNVISFFALSFIYKASIKNRVVAVTLMYLVLMAIEIITVLLFGYVDMYIYLPNEFFTSIAGMISIKIISYITVLLIGNLKNIKKNIIIPSSYWISIFLIPLGTLYIIVIVLQIQTINTYQLISIIFILLFINIVVFYLYDVLSLSFEEKMEKRLLSQQNQYYNKQFEVMKDSIDNIKAIRHDLKNHLYVLDSLMNSNKNKEAIEYLSEIGRNTYSQKEYAHSGNIDIDSMLNYKLYEAESKNIQVFLSLTIPQDLNIKSFDIVVILGNILDNAIRATCKLSDNRKIRINIKYSRGMLIIHVDNTFDRIVNYESGKIVTSKKDKENHGIGLSNVENIVQKYNGIFEISHIEDIFNVDVLMYIK